MGVLFLPMVRSPIISLTSFIMLLLLFGLSCTSFTSTEAYDALDPNGNISIKWDVLGWTPDGYIAVVTISNFQKYRHIQAPGWSLRWTWAKKEFIWNMVGSQATESGNCSRFKRNIPHSCEKTPTIVDLMPSTPYNQQIENCCKGGVLSSLVQDPGRSVAAFQISVGGAGTSSRTVMLPKNFTLKAPGLGYSCGSAKIVKPTRFLTADKRRVTQALMTWNVTCTYSQFLAQKTPTCCVSLSSFYNNKSVPCPKCSCGCQSNTSKCVKPHSSPVISKSDKNSSRSLVQCTSHMCPIQISWEVKENHKQFWLVKIKITNFNYKMNYSDWNLVIQHQNFGNLFQIFKFNYKALTPHAGINDTAMLWGIKNYNHILMQAGRLGTVESELLFRKRGTKSISKKGWAFPRRVYLNGDNCVMTAPDANPSVPN